MEPDTLPTVVDLIGLPEPVVREVVRIVREARQRLADEAAKSGVGRPPLRGRFAHLGLSFPKEDIDEAQREMWANFPREFPDTPAK